MKKLQSLFAIGIITAFLLLPLNAIAAPARPQGEKAAHRSNLLRPKAIRKSALCFNLIPQEPLKAANGHALLIRGM